MALRHRGPVRVYTEKIYEYSIKAFLVWFIGMDIYNFVAHKMSSVSVGGHLGGAVVGLTLGLYILENFYEQKAEKYVSYVGLALFIAFCIFRSVTIIKPKKFIGLILASAGKYSVRFFHHKTKFYLLAFILVTV